MLFKHEELTISKTRLHYRWTNCETGKTDVLIAQKRLVKHCWKIDHKTCFLLVGPFGFTPPPANRNTVPYEYWLLLADLCTGRGICPPARTRERSKTRPSKILPPEEQQNNTDPQHKTMDPTTPTPTASLPLEDSNLRRSKRPRKLKSFNFN